MDILCVAPAMLPVNVVAKPFLPFPVGELSLFQIEGFTRSERPPTK